MKNDSRKNFDALIYLKNFFKKLLLQNISTILQIDLNYKESNLYMLSKFTQLDETTQT